MTMIPNVAARSTACYTRAGMDLFRFDPPTLTVDDALAIAAERYGVTGTGIRLRGERSHNTLITSPDGRRFVLKIASPSEPPATIDLHARALVHLERRAPELPVARMVAALGGELVPELVHAGRSHRMRLVTYLAGVTFDDHQTISIQGLRAIGELMGALSAALRDFEHPAAGDFMPWDIANGLIVDDEYRALSGERGGVERFRVAAGAWGVHARHQSS